MHRRLEDLYGERLVRLVLFGSPARGDADADGLQFSSYAAVVSGFGQRFAKTGRVPAEFHRHLIQAQDSRLLAAS